MRGGRVGLRGLALCFVGSREGVVATGGGGEGLGSGGEGCLGG